MPPQFIAAADSTPFWGERPLNSLERERVEAWGTCGVMRVACRRRLAVPWRAELDLATRTLGRYRTSMSGIAEQLNAKLKALDVQSAASLEKLVRDALELVEAQNGGVRLERLPADFFTRIAAEFGPEPFERPPQGEFEKREPW